MLSAISGFKRNGLLWHDALRIAAPHGGPKKMNPATKGYRCALIGTKVRNNGAISPPSDERRRIGFLLVSVESGGEGGTRTPDPMIMSHVL